MLDIALDAMLAANSALHCAIDTPTMEIDLDRREIPAGLIGDRALCRANIMLGAPVSSYWDIPSNSLGIPGLKDDISISFTSSIACYGLLCTLLINFVREDCDISLFLTD